MADETCARQSSFAFPETRASGVRWFCSNGCVVRKDDMVEVRVGETLIAMFGADDVGARNAVLVGLAHEPKMRMGRLAGAFGVTAEWLRRLKKMYEERGIRAVAQMVGRGQATKVTDKLRMKAEALFAAGLGPKEVYRRLSRRHGVSQTTVHRMREAWKGRRRQEGMAEEAEELTVADGQTQVELGFEGESGRRGEDEAGAKAGKNGTEASRGDDEGEPALAESENAMDVPIGRSLERARGAVQAGRNVQHLGVWVLLAIVGQLGLHEKVAELCERKLQGTTRVMVDAVIAALALGQRCVEGVRRLATPTAALLLRARRCPSAAWARQVLGRFGEQHGHELHFAMALEALTAAKTYMDEEVVLYVDNHTRPYTGKRTVRKAWRMQDKRARPGMTDYWVHDEDGRPVMRFEVPSNEPLTKHLSPVARKLREALGPDVPVLLVFDRAGAYPEQLHELREEGFCFVTYERKPYPLLASTAFDQTVEVKGRTWGACERRTNLGKGRGRVWRLALRSPEGSQVNLLSISRLPTERLTRAMFGRWNQENGIKHGVERWGANQLDGRKVAPYAPDTVIPNPARRRLDRALRIARVREGDARSLLARLRADDPKRNRAEQELEEALAQQEELLAQRPEVPTHAPLCETELADKLVHHTGHLKRVIDTLRVACANAESELALLLAPHLSEPQEAKKTLANLFAAPGDIYCGRDHITLKLRPAGNRVELVAFQALCTQLSRMDLTLPGDPSDRRLQFRSQLL